jgi:hypothetical protein
MVVNRSKTNKDLKFADRTVMTKKIYTLKNNHKTYDKHDQQGKAAFNGRKTYIEHIGIY